MDATSHATLSRERSVLMSTLLATNLISSSTHRQEPSQLPEAMQYVKNYVKQVQDAYNNKDRERISDLIMFDDNLSELAELQKVLYEMTEDSIRSTVQSQLQNGPRPFKNFVTNYLNFTIAAALDSSAYIDVYELLSLCYGSFLALFMAQDAQFLTPLLMAMSRELVEWAIQADKENPRAKEPRISDAAAKHLSRAFNSVINDKVPNALEDSKKMALYYLANLTFRIYFKLKSTRLIPTMIANISKAGVSLANFPMSQQVTHRYYLGRYQLYQLNLRQAERDLSFAFTNCRACHDDDEGLIFKNSRLILTYLTACRLCLGRMPTFPLLSTYDLDGYFWDLSLAVRSGNLRLLNRILSFGPSQGPSGIQEADWLVKKEIYFLLKEKLTVLCWRSLIRRTFLVTRGPHDTQLRVQLETLLRAAQVLTKDADLDLLDLECITASLLDQGYIKGYIHSQKKILVLSNRNPFPTVYSVEVTEEAA